MKKTTIASGRALSLMVLAVALVRVLFLRAFGVKTGLPLFRENYDADRLPPVDADERGELATFSGCFACGLCDVGEGERMRASKGAYPGMMAFVLSASRSMPDYDAAAHAVRDISDEVLRSKERLCPAHVPIGSLVRFVRSKSEAIVGHTQ